MRNIEDYSLRSTKIEDRLFLNFEANNEYEIFFYYEEKARPIVFTDGACSNNGNKKAVAAIGVFWGEDHPL